jgi:ferredoxin
VLKAATATAGFFLVTAGRWVCLSRSGAVEPANVLLVSLSCGLPAAGIAAFTADLVLVRGLLQRKILFIKTLFVSLLLAGILDALSVRYGWGLLRAVSVAETVLVTVLLIVDAARSGGPDYRLAGCEPLPGKYLRPHPVKTVLETLFRLFPSPEPVGLYTIGRPADDSPLFVTGNFDLTVRRAASALKSLDCRLLVCDSRGVNIWCSSMAGHFGTEKIIRAIEETGAADAVSHRRLILPQLCAAAVSIEMLAERTGFRGSFGPLRIKDVQRYLENLHNLQIRTAVFPLKDRLEMALGAPILASLLLVLLFNFIGLKDLLVVLPCLYLYTLLQAAIFPCRPVSRIGLWAAVYGTAVLAVQGLLSWWLFPDRLLPYTLSAGLASAYLVTEFSGWSPLIKYSLVAYKKPRVRVDADLCIGCRRCVEVCPKGVFRMLEDRSTVVNEEGCVICRSCFSQCPTGAVLHSHRTAS